MADFECPEDADWLAWMRDPSDGEQQQRLTVHFDACASCRGRLERLELAEERRAAAAGDDLLDDLRRPLPADDLETEAACASAGVRAGAIALAPPHPAEVSRPPDVADIKALTQRGHYEVLGVLGRGGMGVVYKARNLKMNRLVAIKVLPSLQPQGPGAVARFEREMKAVARLTHPHVVTAYDADEADGKHFLVMEYIDGSDLNSLVKTQGPLPVATAVAYLVQAARGLHHAHEQGIVHRDVKPANLMVDRSGAVKVLDLGLAHLETNAGSHADLTETGVLLGTVDYLAPEQADGAGDVDRRADIYGLGCTLYYLLAGRPLYPGGSVLQKAAAHRDKPIPSLRDACPGCPALLDPVFARMVAKRPEQRYRTMAEVIAALERCTPAAADAPPALSPGGNGGPGERTGRRRPHDKRRALAAAAGLLVCVGALLTAALLYRPGAGRVSDAPEPKTPPPAEAEPVPLARGAEAGQEWDGNGLKMKFCWCPPGRFLMGSPRNESGRTPFEESPQVEVLLSRGFWMGKFEVTQEEWEQVMNTTPSHFRGPGKLPVENITWAEAADFAARLTRQERTRGSLPADWEFRLPTEAQWEYACRAGTTTAYSFGPTTESMGDSMWYAYNADRRPHPVGGKKPNPWGLHDMHGNAWEWCRDWFQPQLLGGTDPEQTEKGTNRVMRGGGFNAGPELCRTAFRSGQLPEKADPVLGFRVAIVEAAPPGASRP